MQSLIKPGLQAAATVGVHVMSDRKAVEAKARANNYKLTPQRIAIIEALVEHKGRFITAQEVLAQARKRHAGTDFSTVYRNRDFEKVGLIHKTSIKGGAAVFELICDYSHHHHIICKGCGKTEIISGCPIEAAGKH